MFIQVEETPNPKTMKFIPGEAVLETHTSLNFTNAKEAEVSPLATRLFKINGIKGVFFGRDFITVSISEQEVWGHVKPKILAYIMDHFVANLPIIDDKLIAQKATRTATVNKDEEDDEIVLLIKELIEERVRPAVAMDGGDIIFERYVDGVVYLQMQGSCSGCPSSTITLKNGIESMLKYYVPEVKEVRSIDQQD